MKKFYITTPIYYPSGKPHLGHAYSTILADVLSKYKKILGYETFFLTGTDEHGQKIEEKAKEMNITPQQLVDMNSSVFKDLWEILGIKNDKFLRTSDEYHKTVVQEIVSELIDKKYVYLGFWDGLYCVSCEENYTKSNVVKKDGFYCCQHGHKLETKKEESYFLKTKEFKEWILNFLNTKDLIYPETRLNELKNSFLNNDEFDDLSISRTTFNWGIKIKENTKHIVYVWLDALTNYITGLGYKQKDDSNYKKFWESNDVEIVHIMSKEITRFHCIYWPIILEMLGIKKPTKFICHGWIITEQGKMSKSLGNVIDPIELINKYGRDALRYSLVKEISYRDDSVFSEELLISTYNSDLANNFGNLINRTLGMLSKYTNSIVPKFEKPTNELNLEFYEFLKSIIIEIKKSIDLLLVQNIIKNIISIFDKSNQLIEKIKPWVLFKEEKRKDLNETMSLLTCSLKIIIFFLQPILIDGTKSAIQQLNINAEEFTLDFIENFSTMDNKKVNMAQPIYMRIEKK